MTPESQQKMDAHVKAIAELLHADATAQGLPMATLGEIEQTVRQQIYFENDKDCLLMVSYSL